MKICVISDTHQKHSLLDIPQCDLLLHCGDITNCGDIEEMNSFNEWIVQLKTLNKIKKCFLIPGNHEVCLDREHAGGRQYYYAALGALKDVDEILINRGASYGDLNFWGFPYVPICGGDWGFQKKDSEIDYLLREIPEDHKIDIFMSHSPPRNVFDTNLFYNNIGSLDIGYFIKQRKPKYHFFGHLHGAINHGILERDGTTFANAVMASWVPGEIKVNSPIFLTI